MNTDKLHRTHARLAISFSLATMVMGASLLVMHFAYPDEKEVRVLVFFLWTVVAVVVLIIETMLFRKIQKQYRMDRDEIKRQIEELLHDTR